MKAIEANKITRECINKIKDSGNQLNDCLAMVRRAAEGGEFTVVYYGDMAEYAHTIKELKHLGYFADHTSRLDAIYISLIQYFVSDK